MLMVPCAVNNMPFLALRVGITQSNISTPKAMFSKILIGVPTPIKYRGLSSGKIPHTTSVIAYISSAGSPTERPPMALPSAPALAIYSADCILRSEEHTSELQSRENLVCRLLLEKKKKK